MARRQHALQQRPEQAWITRQPVQRDFSQSGHHNDVGAHAAHLLRIEHAEAPDLRQRPVEVFRECGRLFLDPRRRLQRRQRRRRLTDSIAPACGVDVATWLLLAHAHAWNRAIGRQRTLFARRANALRHCAWHLRHLMAAGQRKIGDVAHHGLE
jgi:hypothetical protein